MLKTLKLTVATLLLPIVTVAHATERPDFKSVTCERVYARDAGVSADLPASVYKHFKVHQVKGDHWQLIADSITLELSDYRYEPFEVGSMQYNGYKWDIAYQGHKGIVFLQHFTDIGDTVRIEVQGTDLNIDGYACKWR
ncbi:hypothetical protein ORL36_16395 [Klebsiella pasteurii]|uniref:hypothetical protein n=1 Tax=Klebsiella pasteurii TaxID=2587529 RepID=UPI00224781BB|nr:hypothetical protein [Klebsiella pasteurii]MCW9586196.1 hypothetical protein [Klebsiella pasteurii]